MFRVLKRKQRLWQLTNQNNNHSEAETDSKSEDYLSNKLAFNLSSITERLRNNSDVIIREITIGQKKETNGAIVFIDGLVDKVQIERDILAPLMIEAWKTGVEVANDQLFMFIQTKVVPISEVKIKATIHEVVDSVLAGDTVLLIDASEEALILNTKGWEKRAIEEPQTEVIVRGPREGFTETLRTNTAMLRRKINNRNLVFETMQLGEQTKTNICIAYLKGVTNDRLIIEIKRRLKRIVTDSILETGYIEEFIEDAPFSIFATVSHTERPDAVAGKILEGRAAILVDGTPFALTIPTLFIENFQSPEDYYARYYNASLIRWIRYIAFFFSLLSPAIYVALVAFHQELIPTALLISIAAAKEGTPFPAVIEALGMGLIFEILREAGIRLPRPIGQAVSIVGALVIGQAVVSAGIISAPMVIVVALTAIASFVIPSLYDLTSILRIVLTILAGLLGAVGITIGLLGILIHLASLRSFGVPYLAPVAPIAVSGLKDVMVRVPWWAMFKRPELIPDDQERQKFSLMPHPPSDQNHDSERE